MSKKVTEMLNLAHKVNSTYQSGIAHAKFRRDDDRKWQFLSEIVAVRYGMEGGGLVDDSTKESLAKKLKEFFCMIVDEGLTAK